MSESEEIGLHMTVVQAGGYWRAQCECGWSSGAMPFPDPDAAYHAGTLHDAVTHPERIDWKAETAKMQAKIDRPEDRRG